MDDLIVYEEDRLVLVDEVATQIEKIEIAIKNLKAKEDEIRAKLLKEMEENDVIKLETDTLTVTRVEAYDRETFDSKKLREELPEVYDNYVKMTTTKASVRFKVKEK
jgi:regulator of replication initiation timing